MADRRWPESSGGRSPPAQYGRAVDSIVLARILDAGRRAWPSLAPDAAELAAVAAHHADDGEPAHDASVYLAWALACGDPEALRVFERDLVPEIHRAIGRIRIPLGAADEILQVLRVELLVGPPPRIADSGGRGALGGWLAVTATRRALRLARRTHREDQLDDLLLEQLPAQIDPVRAHLRARYTRELAGAVSATFAELEVRQRNLLRQHVLDELSIDELARMYRVHRATIARWVADARADLGRGTRRHLARALELDLGELESMLRFLDSDIELSVSRLLGAA